MRWSKENREFLKRVNSVKVPAALFHDAICALEDLGKDANVFECRAIALFKFLHERGYSQNQVLQLAKAVEFRMEALLRLRSEPGMPEWGVPSDPTADDGHDPYLVAAAEEPLIEHGRNEFAFDRERFQVRMLNMKN